MDGSQEPVQGVGGEYSQGFHDESEHQAVSEESIQDIDNRLKAMGINPAVLIPAAQVDAEQASTAETRRKEAAIQQWQKIVDEVRVDTASMQESLEARLRKDVEAGYVRSREGVEERIRAIDQAVAKGPERSYLYNGHDGDKWARYQTYYETVDEDGNVWREWEPEESEVGITGRPVRPGKRLSIKNPTLPENNDA